MKIYSYDSTDPTDQRHPHDAGDTISPEYMSTKLGVLTFHYPDISSVDQLASSRSYKNRDEITCSPIAMGDMYETKVKIFFEEHLHDDEEIRYILDGCGYFDVRDDSSEGGGRWIRIAVEKGDLIILPAGIYHRFTTQTDDYIKAMRLFKEEPKWTPLNRSPEVDARVYRKEYLKAIGAEA